MSRAVIYADAETAAVSTTLGREGKPDGRRASRARVGRAARARGPAPVTRTRRDTIAAKEGDVFGSAYLGPAVSMRTMAMMAWGLPTSGGCADAMRERHTRAA